MKRVGGDPTLDFVNTVGGRVSGGGPRATSSAPSPTSWPGPGAAASSRTRRRAPCSRPAARRPQEAGRVLARARRLREALYGVLHALKDGRRPRARGPRCGQRRAGGGAAPRPARSRARRPGWRVGGGGRRPGGRAAADMSRRLLASDLGRAVPSATMRRQDCGWLFLDRSRNHSRQWCTMDDCGNVSKVRRFRQRRRGRAGRPGKEVG